LFYGLLNLGLLKYKVFIHIFGTVLIHISARDGIVSPVLMNHAIKVAELLFESTLASKVSY